MKYQNTKIPLKEIVKVFNQINVEEILFIAKSIQVKLVNDKKLILQGKNNQFKLVTQADIEIQKLLLDYFDNSSLKSTYQIIAEETTSNKKNSKNASWKLLIDPLDGTGSFKNQKNTWGVMVGACDNNGILRYSWNLLSTGKIFCSGSKATLINSFENKIKNGKSISIDVYDYNSVISKRFKKIFKDIFKLPINKVYRVSYPAAIWSGYKLFTGTIDGLLWLSSKNGKKWYPDYDLIFLGTLLDKGYKIFIGKKGNNNSMIAIGPTLEDTKKLYEIGLNILPTNQRQKIKKIVNKLKIIN